MKTKKQEVPAVVNSIATGTVRLVIDPEKPRVAFLDIQGVCMSGNVTPDSITALAQDMARLVKSPGFIQWAKQVGSTSSTAARRAAGARKAWETKRKLAAAKLRSKKVTKAEVPATVKKPVQTRSRLNPPQSKSAKLPLTSAL
jgi:hypothetical protein